MKTSAQVGYETHSESFGIDTPQIIKNQSTIRGPIPWDQLDAGVQLRWKIVADAIVHNERVNFLQEAADTIRGIRAKQPTISNEAPSETFICERCGASLMKGENHDCALVIAHRRALGHKLPGDT